MTLASLENTHPEQAFSFWSEWVNNIDDLASVPETWEWPLDAVLTAEKIKSYTADHSVPEHLHTLQDKEHQPTKQASCDGLNMMSKGCIILKRNLACIDMCLRST